MKRKEEGSKSEEPEAFYNRITITTLADLEERDRASHHVKLGIEITQATRHVQRLIAQIRSRRNGHRVVQRGRMAREQPRAQRAVCRADGGERISE